MKSNTLKYLIIIAVLVLVIFIALFSKGSKQKNYSSTPVFNAESYNSNYNNNIKYNNHSLPNIYPSAGYYGNTTSNNSNNNQGQQYYGSPTIKSGGSYLNGSLNYSWYMPSGPTTTGYGSNDSVNGQIYAPNDGSNVYPIDNTEPMVAPSIDPSFLETQTQEEADIDK